ncbi:MAG TPA: carboxypeptidase-like regulatory domain-containing protein [Blastocatellia bacterium]|nr:carboxypeptidase-like regulatory domain-containing protein [Blastocatellia bacterium]
MKLRVKLICFLIAFCVTSTGMFKSLAQTTTSGALEGRVYEEGTNTGIAGATVTIRNQETGLTRTTVTDESGRYFIGTLPPGFYRITAAAQGFEEGPNSSESNFPINITETKRVQPPPISLRRAGAPQTTPTTTTTQQTQTSTSLPEATSAFEQIVNLTNASRGGSVDRRQIVTLPLPGVRTFDDFAFLFAGVAPPPHPIGNSIGPGIGPGVGTTGQFSVNGIRSRSNNFTIDGSDNNDEEVGVRRQGFTSLVPQSIESVQEFQVITLLAEPQFGRGMGAQVNAVSRSGGVDFHGTVYGFLTDKRLRAKDAFDFSGGPATFPLQRQSDSTPVRLGFGGQFLAPTNPSDGENPYTRAQYGFVLGGPLGSEKTNFFVSFEHQDLNASRESHFAVPTVEERGLFGFGAVGLRTIEEDDQGNPLPGRPVLPASPIGGAFFSLFPFPNNPLGPYGRNTYSEVLPADADGTIFSFRLDHPNIRAFGADHSLTGRYNFTDDDTILPVTGEAIFSSLRALTRTQNLSLIFSSTFSSRVVNQARFSFGRTTLGFEEVRNSQLLPSSTLPGEPFLLNAPLLINATEPMFDNGGVLRPGIPRFASLLGLTTEDVTGPLGQVKVAGFSPIGVDVFNFPQGRTNNTFQYADTLFYNLTNHRFTFGFDIRRNQLNSFLERNFRPLAEFSAALDISPGELALQARGIPFFFGSDFVSAGAPTGFYQTQALVRDSTIGIRYWQNNFFVSDQIRLSPTFTLTVGMRYEINSVPREVNNRIENTFTSDEVQRFQSFERDLFGRSGLEQFLAGRTEIFRRDDNNFGPHISFAWDPVGDGRTSVRGGYGIYYDQIPGAVISQSRNVFPSFLTLNLAGLNRDAFDLPDDPFFSFPFINPAFLAADGTLNQFDLGSPAEVARFFSNASDFAAGAGFVLPAADLVTPYAQHWGLTVERQVGRDFLASAGYVGTRGVHLLRFATPNLGPNGIPRVRDIVPVTLDRFLFPGFVGENLAPGFLNTTGGRPFPLLGSFTSIESDANSIYHGLQLQLIKRLSGGVQLTGAYTWSHAIDEVSDLFDTAGASALPQNSFDRAAERGDASFDVRHRFVYSALWDLPFWRDNSLLGGWQVASIGTFMTGQPYSVLFCCDVNLDGNLTDRVSDPNLTDIGASGRNNFRAPGVATVDLTVNKVFRFTEYQNLEFRSEFFNLFNRTHFGVPVRQLFFGGVGLSPLTSQTFVDTRVPARTIQFALKYNF